MARYIVRRLIWAFLMLIAVSGVVFVLFYVFPSADPAQLRAGRQANEDQIEAIRQSLGLDKSVLTQFWIFLKGVFTPFDLPGTDAHGPLYLGRSYQSNADVKDVIFSDLPATALLGYGTWMRRYGGAYQGGEGVTASGSTTVDRTPDHALRPTSSVTTSVTSAHPVAAPRPFAGGVETRSSSSRRPSRP